jgi:hypothetical protein
VRLLLDEMHSPSAAQALRRSGWEVSAVAERPELRGLPDGEILLRAVAEQRALVTENVADFVRLDRIWATVGRAHFGMIFTSSASLDRAHLSYPGELVRRLDGFLSAPPVAGRSWIWWLSEP